MSEFSARSFDQPRRRPVPTVLRGRGPSGAERTVTLERVTLVVVLKPRCDGCADFLASDWHELEGVEVVVVSGDQDREWAESDREVLIAPEWLADLDFRGAPAYLLIDPATNSVLTEGVLFSPGQVANEIAGFLAG